MAKITYQQRAYPLLAGETVLDGLLRQGAAVPHACRAGACRTCLMQCTDGVVPAEAQVDLKDTLRLSDHFLACRCVPTTDLAVRLPRQQLMQFTTQVLAVEPLSSRISRLRLRVPLGFRYRAGQYVNLVGPAGQVRSYSLASVPHWHDHLELHVRRLPGGVVSNWLCDGLRGGDSVRVSEPLGDCFYVPGHPTQPMLFIGTGSGLAPLLGIAHDALRHGHHGPMHLFHGSATVDGLYLIDQLRTMTIKHAHFSYTPTVSRAEPPDGFAAGRPNEVALRRFAKLDGWRVYLCGHPDLVRSATRQAFLAGAAPQHIHTDAFSHASSATGQNA